MWKRYTLLLLMALGAISVGNERVRTSIAFLIEVVKNIPDEVTASSDNPSPATE